MTKPLTCAGNVRVVPSSDSWQMPGGPTVADAPAPPVTPGYASGPPGSVSKYDPTEPDGPVVTRIIASIRIGGSAAVAPCGSGGVCAPPDALAKNPRLVMLTAVAPVVPSQVYFCGDRCIPKP